MDFEPQALCTDMPLFRPVDQFNNNVLFQATKDHSAGQEFDVTKRGNRDSFVLGLYLTIVLGLFVFCGLYWY